MLLLLSIVLQDAAGRNRNYAAWYRPSKATDIYGVCVSVFPEENKPLPDIYGAELNICPLGFFAATMGLPYALIPQVKPETSEMSDSASHGEVKRIQGRQLGLINYEPSAINGIDCSLLSGTDSKTNSIAISVIGNYHDRLNGLGVGTLGNHTIRCRGVQIGLFNTTNELRGIQTRLWNHNGKRGFPILNCNFGRNRKDTRTVPPHGDERN